MKIKKLLLIVIASTLLGGCKNRNNEEPPKEDEPEEVVENLTPDFQFDAQIADTMESLEDKSVYTVKLNYTDKYFKYTASTFKKDLMMLSYGCTMSASTKELGEKFYSDIGFNVLYSAEEYDTGATEESVQFFIASKNIEDFTVFSVGIRGIKYGLEWTNNFIMGEDGDHYGFMASATRVYTKLLSYISNTTNYKLWFSGYSRAGAITNVLSYLCMTSNEIHATEDNLYAYTFAGTRALTEEHAVKYRNVFNLYNSADLLSNFVPDKFGLYRCGTDIDIFDPKIDSYLSSFSSELTFPEFTISKGLYKNDKEYTAYFLSQILKEDTETFKPEKYPYDMCTRQNYHQIERHVSYILGLVLGMENCFEALKETFGSLDPIDMIDLIADDGTALHDKFKEMFEKYLVSYDDEKLMETCSVIVLLVQRYAGLIFQATSNSNINRMIYMHYPETNYILLRRYEND